MRAADHLLGRQDVIRIGRPDEPVGADPEGGLGGLEQLDLLVDERPRRPALVDAAWAMLIECSSVPVRNRVSWPSMRCQRAIASAPMTSYSVWMPGLLLAYAIEVVR
jgi:hypothetical protein